MRVPLSWLSQFVDSEFPNEEIASILTDAGLEVDAIETVGSSFSGVVVGEVLEVQKHPDADKLCVASVSDGQETLQVVCGASNCRQGLKVAFAKVGARLQGSKIKKGKLRGVESFGMLCSVDELGLGGDADGIMELSADAPVGADLSEMVAETIFEISLTPNLGHCSSILGVARELSAATDKPLRFPEIHVNEKGTENPVEVTIKDFKRCPRYACRMVRGVKVAPSPDWMQKKLLAAGFRPVNNVVDVTNYLLMELGHPLHAFDFDRVAGGRIEVRGAKEGERFQTLDGKERRLSEGDVLICDGEKPIAIGGVMGGANSEVGDDTENVLIESAYFDPISIAKTSQRLGLQTDSSKRFERGADPNMVTQALDRAAELIAELGGGAIAKGCVDVKEKTFDPWTIELRLSRVSALLGFTLSTSEVEATLKKLGFGVEWDGKEVFTVTVPTYRPDVRIEVDLIEEVARLYGYNNMDKESAAYQSSSIPHAPLYLFEREMRERLRGEGLQEFLNCDLISPGSLEILQLGEMHQSAVIKVLNPVSEEQSVMRTSLLPGFLDLVKHNQDRQIHDISGFEIGRVYFKREEGYGEQAVAGIVMAGKKRPFDWDHQPEDCDFFDMKGVIENLLDQLEVEGYTIRKSAFPTLHNGRQASILVGQLEVGSFGEVHPSILRKLEITKRVYFAELNLQDLMQVRSKRERMDPLAKYPGSERDWTVTLDEKMPIGDVLSQVKSIPSRLLQDVTLRYLYRSEKIGSDKKNATFHFLYRDSEKTLAQEAVESEHAKIIDETIKNLNL